jgi:hypothetical protein
LLYPTVRVDAQWQNPFSSDCGREILDKSIISTFNVDQVDFSWFPLAKHSLLTAL